MGHLIKKDANQGKEDRVNGEYGLNPYNDSTISNGKGMINKLVFVNYTTNKKYVSQISNGTQDLRRRSGRA